MEGEGGGGGRAAQQADVVGLGDSDCQASTLAVPGVDVETTAGTERRVPLVDVGWRGLANGAAKHMHEGRGMFRVVLVL